MTENEFLETFFDVVFLVQFCFVSKKRTIFFLMPFLQALVNIMGQGCLMCSMCVDLTSYMCEENVNVHVFISWHHHPPFAILCTMIQSKDYKKRRLFFLKTIKICMCTVLTNYSGRSKFHASRISNLYKGIISFWDSTVWFHLNVTVGQWVSRKGALKLALFTWWFLWVIFNCSVVT